jgi:chaperonin GroEL
MSDAIVKNLNFGSDARSKVYEGIEKLTKAVSSTLGASGLSVILENDKGKPVITKDGVTVANNIFLLDPVENMGATLLKDAARKTVQEAGDGTTTATVLAHSILKNAYKALEQDSSRTLKEGIASGVEKVIAYLEKIAIPVDGDMIDQVATISANNDKELGKLISDAFKSVGNTGVVIMQTTDEPDTTIEVVDGVQYDQALKSNHFITNQNTNAAELDNPYILISESPIPNIRRIQSVLEHVIKKNKSLLIIADVEPQVLNTLAMNKMKGNIKVNVIDLPTYGITRKEVMQDLSMLTGAKIINEDLGDDMDLIDIEMLGTCVKAVTNTEETVLQVEGKSEEVEEKIKAIQEELEKPMLPGHKVRYEKRLARLSAKVAVVKVGANSEVELKEKRDRVEDAICATKAAIKEGIVPGGGIALLNAAQKIKSSSKGEELLYKSIKAPFYTILSNAGIEEFEEPTIKGRGLNVVTGGMVNMIKSGIIDPLLVTKSALRNAASVATTIISTDCVINNVRIEQL